ncbi:MAG: hypothetical protein NTY19_08995 [Planctomycetota bacterium]|nr:hypothetical protein [Planctomycetota bacterium]
MVGRVMILVSFCLAILAGQPARAATPPATQLKVVVANNQTVFRISDQPQMPTVVADAQVTPARDLSKVQFRWTAQLRFTGQETPHGKPGTPLDIVKTTTGGHLVINPADWGKIRGGLLTLAVTTTLDAKSYGAQVGGLSILGTNPPLATLRAALGTDVLRRIANFESTFLQFGNDGWPHFSADNLGGAGIMQITPATEDQWWNWRTNVQAGVGVYQDRYRLAATYVQSLEDSQQFGALVAAYNHGRSLQHLPPLMIAVPDFTAEQQMMDAIRGYNGWAGIDPIVPYLHLHEFRLARDAAGQLRVTVIPGTTMAMAIWERVPASARPQGIGDPDYVNHVLARSP